MVQTTTVPAIAPTTLVEHVTSRECTTKFGKLALECTSCTQTDAKDGYILTLKHNSTKEMKTAFGKKVTPISYTFYMKVSEQCEVGFKAEQDLDVFNIVEREFTFTNDETGEPVTAWLKWLHLK